jgi:hypothetical protein
VLDSHIGLRLVGEHVRGEKGEKPESEGCDEESP